MHDLTGTPSSSTVQAPQWVVSQPMCVPVRRSVLAEEVDEQQARFDLGLVRASPLTVTLILWLDHGY